MSEDDALAVLVILGVLTLVVVALAAGDITTQLLSPVPLVAGPLGAAVSLGVFVVSIYKILGLLLSAV